MLVQDGGPPRERRRDASARHRASARASMRCECTTEGRLESLGAMLDCLDECASLRAVDSHHAVRRVALLGKHSREQD